MFVFIFSTPSTTTQFPEVPLHAKDQHMKEPFYTVCCTPWWWANKARKM